MKMCVLILSPGFIAAMALQTWKIPGLYPSIPCQLNSTREKVGQKHDAVPNHIQTFDSRSIRTGRSTSLGQAE